MPAESLVTMFAAVRDLSIAGVVGALVIVATVLPRGHAGVERAVGVARFAAILWVIAALGYSLASYAYIRGASVDPNRLVEEWWSFSTQIPLGQAYLWMLGTAVVASVVIGLVSTPAHAAWSLVPVVWSLAWQAQTGHAAGSVDHHLAVSSMFVHVVGTSLWLGVLVALAAVRPALVGTPGLWVRRATRVAAWGAAAVVASGVVNASLRLAMASDLVTTSYGRLLVIKVVLMTAVLLTALWHRRVLLPRLEADDASRTFWRILTVDVLALVTVVGIAVVMSRMAPPVPVIPVADPSPALYLTGYPLPPAPSLENWLTLWRLELISAIAIGVAAVVYLRWVRRLRARSDGWPLYRVAWFLLGLALLTWITQGAPTIYGKVIFSGHMVEHMFLVMVAPIPLVLGAPVTLALRALSPRTDQSRGPREWVRAIVESRLLRFLAHPVVAAVNFTGSLVVFYYTPLFEFALTNHVGHLWMLAHFTAAGYFFVNALIGIDPGPTRPGHPLRILLLFATMAFHAFFGVAIMSSEALLVPRWFGLMGRDWGPDALTDQQYGGQIAWGIGELPVLLLAIGVFMAWRRADTKEARRQDRKADRDGDASLEQYNAMLAQLRQSEPER